MPYAGSRSWCRPPGPGSTGWPMPAGPDRLVASGCGTDQLDPAATHTLDEVVAAYEEQMEAVEACGSRVVLMASRALARAARGPDDYRAVYDRLLRQAGRPVVLHW